MSWVLSRGGSVQGVAPANLAGRDGASGWGLKAVQVSSRSTLLRGQCTAAHSSRHGSRGLLVSSTRLARQSLSMPCSCRRHISCLLMTRSSHPWPPTTPPTDTWASCPSLPQDLSPGQRLVELPPGCQLTYSAGSTPPALLHIIEQVPQELWGGRLGLQVRWRSGGGRSSRRICTCSSSRAAAASVAVYKSGCCRVALRPCAA